MKGPTDASKDDRGDLEDEFVGKLEDLAEQQTAVPPERQDVHYPAAGEDEEHQKVADVQLQFEQQTPRRTHTNLASTTDVHCPGRQNAIPCIPCGRDEGRRRG